MAVREFGLPVAAVEIGTFEDQKALIVERFDPPPRPGRCLVATYPAGGFLPGARFAALKQVRNRWRAGHPRNHGSVARVRASDADRSVFFKAQLLFWLMAATDGHAKNFSIQLLPGGGYRLTPLYDILSTYPIQGRGTNLLDPRDAPLAMVVGSKSRQYKIHEIHRWHCVAMEERLGLGADIDALIEEMVRKTSSAIERVGGRLPEGFPQTIFDSVAGGMRAAAQRLAAEPDRRG